MPTLFTHLKLPVYPDGPRTFAEFVDNYTPMDRFPARVAATASCLVLLVGMAQSLAHQSWTGALVTVLLAWAIVSSVSFITYAASCCDYGGKALIWLPWRQSWTWVFAALNLPWIPFLAISAARMGWWYAQAWAAYTAHHDWACGWFKRELVRYCVDHAAETWRRELWR